MAEATAILYAVTAAKPLMCATSQGNGSFANPFDKNTTLTVTTAGRDELFTALKKYIASLKQKARGKS